MVTIRDITAECFNAVVALRHVGDDSLLAPALLHTQFIAVLEAMATRARTARYLDEEIDEIRYAIVALIDEVALRKGGPIVMHWMTDLLQMRLFRENVAGDGFFVHLERLLAAPGRSERWRDVLFVYYTCLGLGFQGRYAMQGGESQLVALTQQVGQALGIGGEAMPLSPRAKRPAQARSLSRQAVSVVSVALVALGCAAALYLGLRLHLAGEVARVVERTGLAEDALAARARVVPSAESSAAAPTGQGGE